MADSDRRYQRAPTTRFRPIGDEGVVIRQDAAEALVISDVGARFLELLDPPAKIGKVVEQMLEEYDVERESLETDLGVFLSEMLEAGIVEPVGD